MGVCGGLAKYANQDPNIIRIIAVVLALFSGGSLAIAYIIAGFLLPEGE
jgi:phage shock protein C